MKDFKKERATLKKLQSETERVYRKMRRFVGKDALCVIRFDIERDNLCIHYLDKDCKYRIFIRDLKEYTNFQP